MYWFLCAYVFNSFGKVPVLVIGRSYNESVLSAVTRGLPDFDGGCPCCILTDKECESLLCVLTRSRQCLILATLIGLQWYLIVLIYDSLMIYHSVCVFRKLFSYLYLILGKISLPSF